VLVAVSHGVALRAQEYPKVPEIGSAKDKKDVNDTMDLMMKAYVAKDMATLDRIIGRQNWSLPRRATP
jgi:hypothetical protein